MRKRVLIIGSCGVLLALVVFLLVPSEPVYEGQPLRFWLDQMNYQDTQGRTISVLRNAGTDVVPHLIQMLSYKESGTSRIVRDIIELVTFGHFSATASSDDRNRAANGFKAIGVNGQDAIPEILNLFEDDELYVCAREAIFGIGVVAIPPLIDALESPSYEVRTKSAQILGDFGPSAREATPALIEAFSHSDQDLRRHAATALRKIAPDVAAEANASAIIFNSEK